LNDLGYVLTASVAAKGRIDQTSGKPVDEHKSMNKRIHFELLSQVRLAWEHLMNI